MFDFLRRLFGGNPRRAPPPEDPDLKHRFDQLEREALRAIQEERAAEQLLTPRERIKKRLNLPSELPGDFQADEPAPVFNYLLTNDPTVPTVRVVSRGKVAVFLPLALFEYLYRQGACTADGRKVINNVLLQLGLDADLI